VGTAREGAAGLRNSRSFATSSDSLEESFVGVITWRPKRRSPRPFAAQLCHPSVFYRDDIRALRTGLYRHQYFAIQSSQSDGLAFYRINHVDFKRGDNVIPGTGIKSNPHER